MSQTIYQFIDAQTGLAFGNVISLDVAKESLKGLIPVENLEEFYKIDNATELEYFCKRFHTVDEVLN